jgi:hypothetical protein
MLIGLGRATLAHPHLHVRRSAAQVASTIWQILS